MLEFDSLPSKKALWAQKQSETAETVGMAVLAPRVSKRLQMLAEWLQAIQSAKDGSVFA